MSEIDIDSDTVSTLGVITVSNLKFNVVSDAVLGPVFIRVESSEEFVRSTSSFRTPWSPGRSPSPKAPPSAS